MGLGAALARFAWDLDVMGGVEVGRPAGETCDLLEATAVILAGGLGTRLAPVVGDRPKVLADVGARPFLAYLLDRLAVAGVRRVILCTGHRGGELRAAVGTAYRGMRIAYSEEPTPAGTGGALRLACARTDADPLLVMNGDSFWEFPLPAVWAAHRATGATATLVATEVPDARAFGRVCFGPDGRVTRFEEKSPAPGSAWVNAGVYVLARALACSIAAGRPVSLEREVLPAWIGRGLCAYPARGSFFDIGTPRAYAAAQERLLETGGPP
jgi:NDP-sugar pyrophosphorylase family protein